MLKMPDHWTPLQFDAAVSYLGNYISNKLEERDKNGERLHTLENLLGIPRGKHRNDNDAMRDWLDRMRGKSG